MFTNPLNSLFKNKQKSTSYSASIQSFIYSNDHRINLQFIINGFFFLNVWTGHLKHKIWESKFLTDSHITTVRNTHGPWKIELHPKNNSNDMKLDGLWTQLMYIYGNKQSEGSWGSF